MHNGCSVVDYMIASSSLFPYIVDFGVGTLDMSCHFPLHCALDINNYKQNHDSASLPNTQQSREDTLAVKAGSTKWFKY